MTATCGVQKFRWGEKYNTCQNIGRQHRTTPVGQILGVATPATHAALTPMGWTDPDAVWGRADLRGPNEPCMSGCRLAQPSEYSWTVRARRRWGLHVYLLIAMTASTAASVKQRSVVFPCACLFRLGSNLMQLRLISSASNAISVRFGPSTRRPVLFPVVGSLALWQRRYACHWCHLTF